MPGPKEDEIHSLQTAVAVLKESINHQVGNLDKATAQHVGTSINASMA